MTEELDVKYKIMVKCFTYNHSNYIAESLNGFCIQKTDFPFICAIVDDASIDGTQKVIIDFIKFNFDIIVDEDKIKDSEPFRYIFAHNKTNKNCYFVVYLLKNNHKSQKKLKAPYIKIIQQGTPYTAICEGDDYWTDPLKLQKQVDFMESNPDYTLIFHGVLQKFEATGGIKEWALLEDREYTGNEIIENWIVPTCSVVLRTEILNKKPTNPNFQYGDNVTWLTCAVYGKIYGMSEIMGVYRRHKEGWTLKFSDIVAAHKSYIHFKALRESFKSYEAKIKIKKILDWKIVNLSKFCFLEEYKSHKFNRQHLYTYISNIWKVRNEWKCYKDVFQFNKSFLVISAKNILRK